MQAKILNSSVNNNYSTNQNVAFQGKIKPNKVITKVDKFVSDVGKEISGEKLRKFGVNTIFKPVVKLYNKVVGLFKKVTGFFKEKGHDFVQGAKDGISFGIKKFKMTRQLKSKDINKQKAVIEDLYDSYKIPEKLKQKYIFKIVVPYIKKTKNDELTKHILKYTFESAPNCSVSSASQRIKLITELGGGADNRMNCLEELESYIGEQVGISLDSKFNCQKEAKETAIAAKEAIKKLMNKPISE